MQKNIPTTEDGRIVVRSVSGARIIYMKGTESYIPPAKLPCIPDSENMIPFTASDLTNKSRQ